MSEEDGDKHYGWVSNENDCFYLLNAYEEFKKEKSKEIENLRTRYEQKLQEKYNNTYKKLLFDKNYNVDEEINQIIKKKEEENKRMRKEMEKMKQMTQNKEEKMEKMKQIYKRKMFEEDGDKYYGGVSNENDCLYLLNAYEEFKKEKSKEIENLITHYEQKLQEKDNNTYKKLLFGKNYNVDEEINQIIQKKKRIKE